MKRKIIAKIILITLLVLLTSITTVYAVLSIESSSVSYDNMTTGLPNTVQGAIDTLYTRQKVELEDWKGRYYALLNDPNQIPLRDYLRGVLEENGTTVLQDDGSGDANMRYIGTSPNNYVTFNGEDWRIIGVFNSNSHGMNEELVKIVKDQIIGSMPFDENDENDWTTSTLKDYLNIDYYNSLSSSSQKMIQNVNWRIGGYVRDTSARIPTRMYNGERGNAGSYSAPTKTTWNDPGYIAIPYATDIYFSVADGTYTRNECLQANTYEQTTKWRNDNNSCAKKGWFSNLYGTPMIWCFPLITDSTKAAIFYQKMSKKRVF